MSSPTRHARLMELFDEACDLPRPDIKVWLENLTGFDADLKQELGAMLDVDGRSEVFHTRGAESLLARDLLDTALSKTPALPTSEAATPTQLGEYEVLEKLGSGGMGSVYRARQQSPARVVALKTLHPWLVSPSSLERFRFEAQALASLTHPSIPPVYAVGQHAGLVYFAMELVEGPSLAKWVKDQALDVARKVELLARVAEAVHHAHLRGFVHRDLKPDNVRVTAEGTPKVLDFGIAAGLGSHRAEVAGTPAYMSPEQFEPTESVDVRTDVYSLGVMLFELLTGRLPHDLPKSGLATLREAKKAPPLRLGDVASSWGYELDAIVARALATRVEQRYASAQELADDLRHWLKHEPVQAVGGGRWYRAGRFVRRNRVLVATVALAVVALVAGTITSTWFFFDAQAAAKAAELDASRAKQSVEFLASVLNEADGDNKGGRGATIGQAIDHAVEKLEQQQVDPFVEAFLRASLTNTYVGLGEWQHARTQALAALKLYDEGRLPRDEQYSEVLRVVSEVHVEVGKMKEGLEAAEASLQFEESLHGKGPHEHTAYSLHVVGIARRYNNDYARAVEAHQRAIEMERAIQAATGNSYLVDALDQLCLTLVTWGRYDEARPYVAESIELTRKAVGRDHQIAALSYTHLGWLELNAENLDAARVILHESNEIRLRTLGPKHMRYAQGLHNLAQIEILAKRYDVAAPLLEQALAVARTAFGEETGRYAWLECLQVDVLLGQGKAAEALALAERDVKLIDAMYGPDRDASLQSTVQYAKALAANGREVEAKAAARRAVEMAARMYGVERPLYRRQAEALPR